MSKESFLLFKSFYEPVKDLSREQKGDLFDAIFRYQIDGSEPDKSSDIFMAFLFFKNQFRLDEVKYQKVVERNKDNGNKGGRPKKPKKAKATQNNPENPPGLSEPKKADNDNGNVNDNVKEKVKDNVFLHRREIEKLKTQFSDEEIEWMYEKLSSYKLSSGKNYKSDYGAICNWVVDRLKEEKGKEKSSVKKESNGDYDKTKRQEVTWPT